MALSIGSIFAKFHALIHSLTPEDVAKNPSRDFSRTRKLSIEDLFMWLIRLGRDCLDTELRNLFKGRPGDAPTKSAVVQQRAKLSDNALPYVFNQFNNTFPVSQTVNGVHIFAGDGSDLNIPPDGDDASAFIPYNSNNGGYHQYHVNTIYGISEHRFIDVVVQPRKTLNENAALCEMVRRNPVEGECLYIMDRGYNSLHLMATIRETGNYFLIRLKDPGKGSMVDCFKLPDGKEYDIPLEFYVSRSRKSADRDKAGFKKLMAHQKFDYLDPKNPADTYIIPFRLIKIHLKDGTYEYLITNLPKDRFPHHMMKYLYHLRWSQETAYFLLKYKADLSFLHSRKRKYVTQEIYARLILYNLTLLLAGSVTVKKEGTKYEYKVNITQAFVTCRFLLRGDLAPDDVYHELCRYVTPIRPDRHYERKMRSQRLPPLNNRN